MSDTIQEMRETLYRNDCGKAGIAYVAPGCEGREEMEKSVAEFRIREQEERTARQSEAERLRAETLAREEEERSLNSDRLTARELLRRWEKDTPLRFRDADIANVANAKLTNAILDGASALVLGSNGAGKTYMAYALAKAWSAKAHDAVVIKATELLGTLKSSADPFRRARESFGKGVRHLVIDEADKIFESKADFVYLNYLIDYRYEWMMQTVVLGNGSKEDFIGNLGQSIYSRLTGDGGIGIYLNRPDRRKTDK